MSPWLAIAAAWSQAPTTGEGVRADAAVARRVIERCRVDPSCPEGRRGLAEAFVAVALHGAVVDGIADGRAAANARQLDPMVADAWGGLLAVASTDPAPWVVAWSPRPTGSRVEGGEPLGFPVQRSWGFSGGVPLEVAVIGQYGARGGVDRPRRFRGLTERSTLGSFTLRVDSRAGRLAVTADVVGSRARVADVRQYRSQQRGPVGSYAVFNSRPDITVLGLETFVGVGPRWGSTGQELRVSLGPLLGSSGPTASSYTSAFDYGEPDPRPWHLGARLATRLRTEVGRNVAIELRSDVSIARVFHPERYLFRSDRPGWLEVGVTIPDATRLRVSVLAEVQRRVARRLWLTLGGWFVETPSWRRIAIDEEPSKAVSVQDRHLMLVLGARWR